MPALAFSWRKWTSRRQLKPTHYNLSSPRERLSMKRRVPQYCPGDTAQGHRIGHPGAPLPTVTPGVHMLSQGWAVFLKASCHGAGRPAGLTSAWVMAAKSLVSQAICGLRLGSGAESPLTPLPHASFQVLDTWPPTSLSRHFRPPGSLKRP